MNQAAAVPQAKADELPLPSRPVAFLWHYICARPWHFGGLLALIIGAASCAVAVQYGMKLLVDAMAQGTSDRGSANVWWPLGLFIGLIVTENVFWRLGGWLGCRTVVASVVDIRVDLFKHLTGHPMRYFTEHFAGSLGNRISALGAAAGSIYGGLAWKIVPPIVDFLGAVVVLFTVGWQMAVALIVFVAIVAALITGFGIRGRSKHQRFAAQSARVGGELVDAVSNVWTIKAFSARDREAERLAHEIGYEARAQRRSWMYLEKARVMHDICLSVMAGGMLIWAIQLWIGGSVTAGDVVLVSALTFRILHGSRDLALALVDATQQLGAIDDTLRIIVQPHGLEDTDTQLMLAEGDITFEGVGFGYPERGMVFEQLDLHIPAGQKVGVVGSSGAGKSTLIHLIQRLDDVQHGRILLDGQDIRSVSQDSLREKIAVVPQETALFNRSIRENIRYGRLDATDEEVIAAAKATYVDRFVHALPDGYDTIIDQDGGAISAGERQLITIARAFLAQPALLILDEATSSVDTRTEVLVQEAMNALRADRTSFVIAHRLSTIRDADLILVMENGTIVEQGSHDDLLAAQGAYWRLHQSQFAQG